MKRLIVLLVIGVFAVPFVSFAGTFEFEIEGATLKPIYEKAVRAMIENAGINPENADVLISVKPSEDLTRQMGVPIVFVETIILIGDGEHPFEGRVGFQKKHLFEAIKRSVREAVASFK